MFISFVCVWWGLVEKASVHVISSKQQLIQNFQNLNPVFIDTKQVIY